MPPKALMTIADLLDDARRRLRAAPFAPDTREATSLLGAVLSLSEAQVLARTRDPVPAAAAERFEALLARRLTGEPVAYLLGRRAFWDRWFQVDDRVLIPRPETEHLIEVALGLSLPEAPHIVDVGAGSGCIALTLALERPDARVSALDRSPAALAVVAANRRALDSDGDLERRVSLVAADLLAPLRLESADLVVSNPPYVDPAERERLSPEVVKFEPSMALFADAGGRDLLDRLLDEASGLRPGTPIVLEIGYDQGAWIAEAAEARPWLDLEDLVHDYGGHPRTALLRRRDAVRRRPATGR